jgi:hypothetical protein
MNRGIKKIVLAYSGGLDTSVILKWLQETYDAEVVAFCADLGQGEDLQAIKAKAQRLGVKKVYVEDLRETFVKEYVFPMLRGNAMYEGSYLLGTSIARPLIARRQAEIALKEGAEAVSHGATGKGNDQVRFELTYMALAPALKIIAPWREWTMRSRRELIEYAERHGIPVTATKAKPYSMDLSEADPPSVVFLGRRNLNRLIDRHQHGRDLVLADLRFRTRRNHREYQHPHACAFLPRADPKFRDGRIDPGLQTPRRNRRHWPSCGMGRGRRGHLSAERSVTDDDSPRALRQSLRVLGECCQGAALCGCRGRGSNHHNQRERTCSHGPP